MIRPPHFDAAPPHSIEAEACLLGSLILDHRMIAEAAEILTGAGDFYSAAHESIWSALMALDDRKQSSDMAQLIDALRDVGTLEDVGGVAYLVRIAEGVPSAVNAPHYARTVRTKADQRRVIDSCLQAAFDVHNAAEQDASKAIDAAEQAIYLAASEGRAGASSGPQPLSAQLERHFLELQKRDGRAVTGLATGLNDLDRMTCGINPGDLWIIAARPSMGKSALALELARAVAWHGRKFSNLEDPTCPVALFSLEMSREQLMERLIAMQARVDSRLVRMNRLSPHQFEAVSKAVDVLQAHPLFIDDTGGLTVMQWRSRARRLVSQHGVRLLIVDYLQLLTDPRAARENRTVEVSAISRTLKATARELNVPVIALAQLNRNLESRQNKRPMMADLRESGSIEQDADNILFLHREAYYREQAGDQQWFIDHPDLAELAELIVAKQRNGPTGTVELRWLKDLAMFEDPAKVHRGAPMGASGRQIHAYEDETEDVPF